MAFIAAYEALTPSTWLRCALRWWRSIGCPARDPTAGWADPRSAVTTAGR
ncbi:MAG: hypothetical protein ACRDS0_10980 [Pseudonocardiaceae bacterium]